MTATLDQARDEVLTVFKTAWELDATSQNIPVLYWDVADDIPDSGAWVRISMRHLGGRQATLRGATGERRYRYTGIVTVQVFTPFSEGMVLNDALATIAKNAFEGVTTDPGRVILRNVRINEIGPDGQWFNTNVLADFEYDEVR